MDMEQRDYDSRTALHVAAAEGKNTDTAVNVSDDQCVCVCVCVCVFRELMCVFPCVFQDMPRWFASCWRPVRSTQSPKTGNRNSWRFT